MIVFKEEEESGYKDNLNIAYFQSYKNRYFLIYI